MGDRARLARVAERLNTIIAMQEKLEKEKFLLIREYIQIYTRLNDGQDDKQTGN